MDVVPCGAVPSMHSTIVSELGNYTKNMAIGDKHGMNFGERMIYVHSGWVMISNYVQNMTHKLDLIKNDYTKGVLLPTLQRDLYDTTKESFLKLELLL